MSILITGCAGFIGFHLTRKLLQNEINIVGIDNLNDYYDKHLKSSRLKELKTFARGYEARFDFNCINIEDNHAIKDLFKKNEISCVIHLAAQAGVRYSLENPSLYIKSNVVGFGTLIELCKVNNIKNFIYASSSSVYGGNTNIPFSEKNSADHPVSVYAATKRSNELLAHAYSHLFNFPTIGLRFFTVYGPWGRPDMAPFIFTKSIIEGKPIKVLNHGKMKRDFTYIDDIIECIFRLIKKPAISNKEFNKSLPDSSSSWAPFRIFNIGNSKSIDLLEFISTLEEVIGIKAKKQFLPMQPGDVEETFAKTDEIEQYVNFKPNTKLKEGITSFVNWYKNYYKVTN